MKYSIGLYLEICYIYSSPDIAEILLELALNINQSIMEHVIFVVLNFI